MSQNIVKAQKNSDESNSSRNQNTKAMSPGSHPASFSPTSADSEMPSKARPPTPLHWSLGPPPHDQSNMNWAATHVQSSPQNSKSTAQHPRSQKSTTSASRGTPSQRGGWRPLSRGAIEARVIAMSEEEKRAWRLKNFGTEKYFDDLDDIMEGYPDLDYEMNAMKKD